MSPKIQWVWGNALRCWIKWHIFWNVAKHPISFKDETEAAPGIIQHSSKCVVVWNEDLKSGKQKMKKRKLFLESDFWRRKQLSRERNSLSWKAWSCRSSTCKAKMLTGTQQKMFKFFQNWDPRSYCYLPQIKMSAWRLWELCLCTHWELSPSSQFWGILY